MRFLSRKHTLLTGATLAGALVLAGCDNDDPLAQLRVIHASSDAPPVNVFVDSANPVSGLDYADSSGFVNVVAGTRDIVVQAIRPEPLADLSVITVNGLTLSEGSQTTVMAIDDTATIREQVIAGSASEPTSSEVAISVVHASPDPAAANVDVYITDATTALTGITPDFNFDFTDEQDVGAVAAGTYRIRVTGAGSKTPAYDSGPVDLTPFAGQSLVIAAVNTVNSVTSDASPIKLMAYTDSAQVELLDTGTLTAAKVVHLSSDAGTVAAGPVEVFATSTLLTPNPTELIPAFSYLDVEPAVNDYVDVPVDATTRTGDYVFSVAADGAGIGSAVFTSDTQTLAAGGEATVIAAGYVGMTPSFDLLVTADNNRSVATQASVKVVHGAPSAGTVDVYVTPTGDFTVTEVEMGMATPLLPDFTYGTITDYVAVAPGDYDIRVVAGGTAAINVEGFTLGAGLVATVIAREPDGDGTPSDFGLVVLTN